MGNKVFVSYKYGDKNVQVINGISDTIVRDYVNHLQDMFEETPHIWKAEEDGNDLSQFKDSTIESKLRDKIYDSSVTIILISPNMWDKSLNENDQWIPWEISYSLKEHSRNDRTSYSNAILAVVLPDINGSYNYFIEDNTCPYCNCRTVKRDILFTILKKNMFNIKPEYELRSSCANHYDNNKPYQGYPSYIESVKWVDFAEDKSSISRYINIALEINDNIKDYNITKVL